MAKRKKKDEKNLPVLNENDINILQTDLIEELSSNPDFSLQVDPENKYDFTYIQKKFIMYYVQYKDVQLVCDLLQISIEDGKDFLINYQIQQEIRRINRALYQHQFANKMLTLDEIGGYLSSLITDDYNPNCKQLDTYGKLKVVDTLINLIKYKNESIMDPKNIIHNDIDIEIKDLSIKTIQQLLKASEKNDSKNVNEAQNLLPEEKALLSSLSSNELLNIINETNLQEVKNE